MNYICDNIEKNDLAEKVEFEILEYEDIRDYSATTIYINRLKRLGCKAGIDDLGKRYSNFDRLFNLPFDYIKIDGGILCLSSKTIRMHLTLPKIL